VIVSSPLRITAFQPGMPNTWRMRCRRPALEPVGRGCSPDAKHYLGGSLEFMGVAVRAKEGLPVRLALTTGEAHDNRLAAKLLSRLKSGFLCSVMSRASCSLSLS